MNPETLGLGIELYFHNQHFCFEGKHETPCVKNNKDRKKLEKNVVEGIVNSMWRFKRVYGESFSLRGYKFVVW